MSTNTAPHPPERSRRHQVTTHLRRTAAAVLRRCRDALSSPNALALAALVSVVALILGLYVIFAQINLTNCLARYNEASASATAARAAAAAEDRATDLEERRLAETERERQAANDVALDRVLILMARASTGQASRAEVQQAFTNMLVVRDTSAKVRSANETRRAELAERRAATDLRRRAHPVPDPPSTLCGGSVTTALIRLVVG